jgi:uncharacterized coiled-coil protein SlyX
MFGRKAKRIKELRFEKLELKAAFGKKHRALIDAIKPRLYEKNNEIARLEIALQEANEAMDLLSSQPVISEPITETPPRSFYRRLYRRFYRHSCMV